MITILRSVGPVISTRRSAGPAAPPRPATAVLAHAARLLEEVGQLAGEQPLLALGATREQLLAASAEGALQAGDEVERLVREDLGVALAAELDARREVACHAL